MRARSLFVINLRKFKTTLFAFFIYATIVIDLFRILNTSVLHLGDNYTTLFRNIVYIFLFACSLFASFYNSKKLMTFIALATIYAAITMISVMINPEIAAILRNNILIVFSRIIPAYIIASSIENPDEVIEKVVNLKWVLLAYLLVFVSLGTNSTRYYYMNVGYNLLFPTLIMLFNARKKLINQIICVFSIVVILLFCARGTALVLIPSIAGFYVVNLLRGEKNRKKIIAIMLLGLLAMGIFIFLPAILLKLYQMFPSSRTLYYMISGNIMDSSGRDNYYSTGITEVLSHPFRIRGILGDRAFYGHQFGINDFEGAFAHNVILETMLQFGVIGGMICTIFLLNRLINASKIVFSNKQHSLDILYWAIVVPAFLICMTTASYLSSDETSLMLGICSSMIALKVKGKRGIYKR